MWKAGQLVTLNGVVYRIKRKPKWIGCACKFCYFLCGSSWGGKCEFQLCNPKLNPCWYHIPNDCYFARVYPKS